MALTAAEQAIFDSIPSDDAPAPAAPVVDELPPADDTDAEDAALQKQLADAQAALEAKKAKRKMKMTDTDASGAPIVPPPPAPAPEQLAPACKCGEAITPENGSKLQDGSWKHVGCKLDAPKVETPAPRARKPKADAPPPPIPGTPTPAPKPAPTPLAPPVFAGESASDRAARAAAEAVANAPKPTATKPTEETAIVTNLRIASLPLDGVPTTREALANVLFNLAVLVRSVA